MTADRAGALPNLIAIGSQKSGTSSLHYYLGLHPEIQMSSPKELNFFVAESNAEALGVEPGERHLVKSIANWPRGRSWYESHFDARAPVRGESSVAYTAPWGGSVPRRMAELLPDARLIYLVRDPVERIVSNYNFLRAWGRETLPLPEAVRRAPTVYVERSRYVARLRPFLELYPRSRILIVRQEDLLQRRAETMRHVFGWLGVDPGFWSPKMERERNVTGRQGDRIRLIRRLKRMRVSAVAFRLPQEVKWVIERLYGPLGSRGRPAIDEGLRRELIEALEPDITELEEITGWDLSQWRAPQRERVEA